MIASYWWGFWIEEDGDPNRIKIAMDRFDNDMEPLMGVKKFHYGVESTGSSVIFKGYIVFWDRTEEYSVNNLLPEFYIGPIMDYRGAVELRGILMERCFFTKWGLRQYDPNEHHINIHVSFHYELLHSDIPDNEHSQ